MKCARPVECENYSIGTCPVECENYSMGAYFTGTRETRK